MTSDTERLTFFEDQSGDTHEPSQFTVKNQAMNAVEVKIKAGNIPDGMPTNFANWTGYRAVLTHGGSTRGGIVSMAQSQYGNANVYITFDSP